MSTQVDFGLNSRFFVIPAPFCNGVNSSRNPEHNLERKNLWIPAFASMTNRISLLSELAHVHSVHISLYFASP
jgi:hypothetical protein